jgi:N-acetyl-anhydromuramyl-L-alanine amidase AmpD
MEINKSLKLTDNQYYKTEQPKKIIVLHHTVSGKGVAGDVNWWNNTPDRIATSFIVEREKGVYQVFDEKYWAHHLGITASTLKQYGSSVSNQRLNQLSIGIEIDSWGGLTKGGDGNWYAGKICIEKSNVQEYPKGFRGFYAFEKYTKKQIADVKQLLLYLNKKYEIPLKYNPEMWEVSRKALVGTHGVFSHVSYRPDKSDCHPQPELIEMLKSLSV